MPRLRTMTSTTTAAALATAVLLAAAPAHAEEWPAEARCDFAFAVPPNSSDAVWSLSGSAVATSTAVVRTIRLTCDFTIGSEQVILHGSAVGPAVAVAGSTVATLGIVTVCTTVAVTWLDGSEDEATECRTP